MKSTTVTSIHHKILALYILNNTDILFTLSLLKSGLYKEANTIVAPLLRNPSHLILIKVVLPAVLLSFISLRIKRATDEQLKLSNIFINIILAIYVLINISHVLGVMLCLYLRV